MITKNASPLYLSCQCSRRDSSVRRPMIASPNESMIQACIRSAAYSYWNGTPSPARVQTVAYTKHACSSPTARPHAMMVLTWTALTCVEHSSSSLRSTPSARRRPQGSRPPRGSQRGSQIATARKRRIERARPIILMRVEDLIFCFALTPRPCGGRKKTWLHMASDTRRTTSDAIDRSTAWTLKTKKSWSRSASKTTWKNVHAMCAE
mmetsp:Transcript_17190/g.52870  ORF Transcript_17190/g.52870 Transcript_17190/m.52870 type:complete len:207 (+) Transcript_17190:1074-1694(+)